MPHHSHQAHDEQHEHVVPAWLLHLIFVLLLGLTILTVAAIKVDVGNYNIVIAIGIATVKALLVVFYFMHLKWDRAFHALCVFGAIGFVGILIAYTMIDTREYGREIHTQDVQEVRAAP